MPWAGVGRRIGEGPWVIAVPLAGVGRRAGPLPWVRGVPWAGAAFDGFDVGAGSSVFGGIGWSTTATTFQLGSGCVSSTVFRSPETSLTWEESSGVSRSFHPALLFASDSAWASARRTAGPSESDRRFLGTCGSPPFASSGRCTGRVTIFNSSRRDLSGGWREGWHIFNGQPVDGRSGRVP